MNPLACLVLAWWISSKVGVDRRAAGSFIAVRQQNIPDLWEGFSLGWRVRGPEGTSQWEWGGCRIHGPGNWKSWWICKFHVIYFCLPYLLSSLTMMGQRHSPFSYDSTCAQVQRYSPQGKAGWPGSLKWLRSWKKWLHSACIFEFLQRGRESSRDWGNSGHHRR